MSARLHNRALSKGCVCRRPSSPTVPAQHTQHIPQTHDTTQKVGQDQPEPPHADLGRSFHSASAVTADQLFAAHNTQCVPPSSPQQLLPSQFASPTESSSRHPHLPSSASVSHPTLRSLDAFITALLDGPVHLPLPLRFSSPQHPPRRPLPPQSAVPIAGAERQPHSQLSFFVAAPASFCFSSPILSPTGIFTSFLATSSLPQASLRPPLLLGRRLSAHPFIQLTTSVRTPRLPASPPHLLFAFLSASPPQRLNAALVHLPSINSSAPQLHPFSLSAWVASTAYSLTTNTAVITITTISIPAPITTIYTTFTPNITISTNPLNLLSSLAVPELLSCTSRSLRLSGGGDPAVPDSPSDAPRL